jgi:hypothetical protein
VVLLLPPVTLFLKTGLGVVGNADHTGGGNMNISDTSIMLAEKSVASEFNHTEHIYIDICGDLIAGTLLSQILYWFRPSLEGHTKIRINKGGFLWMAKCRDDWWDEIRITPKQYDRAIKVLQNMGFVETRLFRYDGHATTHIRPIPENINKATSEWVQNKAISFENTYENPENSQISPKVKTSSFPQRSNLITENINSIVKYRDTYEYQNNKDLLSISIKQSMVSPQTTQKGWFEYLDISNNAMLISELDKIQYFKKDDPKYDYLYTVFSTFADEFIKHRGYKHKEISCIDLNKMSTKLSSFVQKEYIPETDEYVVKNPRRFSIYEYEKDDLVWMVKDYFEYQFDDCDYSLWHFMSDSVLSARFWRMENRCTESVI